MRAFSPNGTELVYQGAIDPHTPIAYGWLRASHRALGNDQSRSFLPVHRHDRAELLTPAGLYEVDVEIPPTSVTLAKKASFMWRSQIDIGKRSPAFPVTPPYVRVRIRRFGGLSDYRTVNLGIPSESK